MSSLYDYTTHVLIAGAGPAGASVSIFLSKENIPHIIIDKAVFPRDKICGDAMSGKTLGMLKRITGDWHKHFIKEKDTAVVSAGIKFISGNNTCLDIPFQLTDIADGDPPGFVSKRIDFDNSLFNLIAGKYAHCITGTSIEDIQYIDDGLLIKVKQGGKEKTIFSKMIVGAEGRSSIVAKKLAHHKVEAKHYRDRKSVV